jgi:hypothetical protein
MGRLTTLLLWNRLDPADDRERRRNDLVYERYQQNRNPFVDHPEWVEAAFLPALTIRHEDINVVVEWPEEFSSAMVETTLGIATSWSALTNTPVLANGRWHLIPPATSEAQFYRLRLR